MTKQISIKTRLGWISAFENKGKIFKIKFEKLEKQKKSKILLMFRKELLSFFNKKTKNIKTPHTIVGNKIQKKIWSELKKIKIGQTKTYGSIAKKYRISPRYVGKICGQNNLLLLVPCHRVIKTDGSLGGFSSVGGVQLKKKLLDFEKNWN
jgi:methylated-DNA-[protein]-cysteine S-methyltransferase